MSLDGRAEITGTFAQGKEEGVFSFFGGAGDKLAEIPYHDGRIDGTVRLWYTRMSTHGVMGQRKLVASYTEGVPDGDKLSWYPNDARRAVFHYTRGRLDRAEMWFPDGTPGTSAEARATAAHDLDADAQYYHVLKKEIRENPPPCASR